MELECKGKKIVECTVLNSKKGANYIIRVMSSQSRLLETLGTVGKIPPENKNLSK